MTERRSWWKPAAKIAAVVGVLLAVVAVRVVTSARAELETADRLQAKGDLETAIVHYRRAASWYAPGNPFSADALARLGALGREAEEREDDDTALQAWRSIRSAILSARSLYTPHPNRLEAANARIAALLAEEQPPPIDSGKTQEELRAAHLALLTESARPSPLWSLVLVLGFAAWVGGAFAFVLRAVDDEDRLRPKRARLWGTVIIVGFGLWILGMALA